MKTLWLFILSGTALGACSWILFLTCLAWVWGVGGGVAIAVITQPEEMLILLVAGLIGATLGFSIWLVAPRSRPIG